LAEAPRPVVVRIKEEDKEEVVSKQRREKEEEKNDAHRIRRGNFYRPWKVSVRAPLPPQRDIF
jgi:hypothetical protein